MRYNYMYLKKKAYNTDMSDNWYFIRSFFLFCQEFGPVYHYSYTYTTSVA